MTQQFDLAYAYITTLTGSADTVMDFRCIHDTDKSVPAHNFRGPLTEVWPTLVNYNQRGYGIFVCMNQLDGQGRELANVQFIRAHAADLDNPLTSKSNLDRACQVYPQPHFVVLSSPNKYHIYWLMQPYTGNEFFTAQQRKLAQIYDGDTKIIDATRVLRVPGFYHLKGEPFMTTCWAIHNGPRWTAQQIGDALAHVNVINHIGMRSPLGDVSMAAPSVDWLKFALNMLDPNQLDRQAWLSISAAFKQAGWTLTDEKTLLSIWQEWCNRYEKNDLGENLKMWHSVRDTEVGWAAFLRRTMVNAYLSFGANPPTLQVAQGVVAHAGEQQSSSLSAVGSTPTHPTNYEYPELLSPEECKMWFKDCYFIARTGEIFSPLGRYMNSTQFNGLYGGKHFIITTQGKSTDEAWKAALRSTAYTIPKVDHVRFLPMEKPFAVIADKLGRKGLNTYIPITCDAEPGDVTPWLDHVAKILPDQRDRDVWFNYIAHAVKFPGYKIPWAPLLQSTEGVGKTVFFNVMQHALGDMYVYRPKAPELVSSGSKFNAWMRGKLCIVVDEIKIDERRELIEILKPMITDAQVEVQAKGVDQEMEDNPANWIFFSNYKDAIPIHQNGRRYAVFYSVLQSKKDMLDAGMDDAYFERLWSWLDDVGYKRITHWLKNYPIARGQIARVAPETSSHAEALRISRSPMQVEIENALHDGLQGFRGGYISNLAVVRRVTSSGTKAPSAHSIRTLLEGMGYIELGRAKTVYPFEDMTNRPIIYANDPTLTLDGYGTAQGYDLT